MKAKKLLITGASGLLGATALKQWPRQGWEILGTYQTHPIALAGVQTVQMDLGDLDTTNHLLSSFKPDVIFHTAAAVNVDRCEEQREWAFRMNAELPLELAKYSSKAGSLLIHVSTDAFFDGPAGHRFSETDTPLPQSYYAETKLLGENNIIRETEEHLILRTNLYGWNYQNKQSLAEWMLIKLAQGQKIPLFRDVFYTPILTNTFVEATLQLLDRHRGVFNVAGEESLSKLEFGKRLCEIFDISPDSIIDSSVNDLKLKAKRSTNMSLDVTKLKTTLAHLDLNLNSQLRQFRKLYESGYVSELKGEPFQIDFLGLP